jgi:hypothetical protein
MGWLHGDKKRNVYAGLRQQILDLTPATMHLAPSVEHPHVYGGLMEMGMGGDIATLAVVADGTTSLYWSTGGGIIGAGFHEVVKGPSKAFLAALERHVAEFGADSSGTTPTAGMIHLRALTFDRGRLLTAGPETDFAEKRNPMWDVFFAGHALIAAIRKLPNIEKAS